MSLPEDLLQRPLFLCTGQAGGAEEPPGSSPQAVGLVHRRPRSQAATAVPLGQAATTLGSLCRRRLLWQTLIDCTSVSSVFWLHHETSGASLAKDRTHAPCSGSSNPNHWSSRGVLTTHLYWWPHRSTYSSVVCSVSPE